jgi:rootletin
MKQELNRLESEKRHLQKEIRYSESRATEMEIQRMSLDGDLQRLQMKLQEKEARIEVRNIYNFKYLTV